MPRGAGGACRRRAGQVRQQRRPSLFVLSWGGDYFGEGEVPSSPQRTPERGRCWRTSQHDPGLLGYRDKAPATATFPLRLCSQNWGDGAVMVSIKKGKKYPSSSVGREIRELGSDAASSPGAGRDVSTFLTRELFNPGKPSPSPGRAAGNPCCPWKGEAGEVPGSKGRWQGRIKTLDYRTPSGIAHSRSTCQAPCPESGKDRILRFLLLPELLKEAAILGRNLHNYLRS